jgi:membrane-bound lytic murein transglycosylase D
MRAVNHCIKFQLNSKFLSLLIGLSFSEALYGAMLPGRTVPLNAEMEQEVIHFNRLSNLLLIKDECVPVRVGGIGRIDFQYLSCSETAKSKNAIGEKIAGDITVPDALAQRFNFWRRVYSLWSKNQYVMHISEMPEVVLEIHDSTRIEDMGDKAREKFMKPWLDVRRREYQQVLLKLHRSKNLDESQLTQVEKRIYGLFEHVQRKDKFLIAAQSIRVQRGQREYIEKGLVTASKYLPHLEESFKKEGVPAEFARIAFIESSFNLQAMSKVGASGVYQIMPDTGRDYLVIDNGVDERNDPIKASRAAAKLLLLNYKILGSWPLAITAYNHGVGGINRAMRATGSNDLVKLIEKYDGPNFGFASKNFYTGFLGLLATLERANKVFPNLKLDEPLNYQLVNVGNLSISEIKSKYRISSGTLVALNPDISHSFIRQNLPFPARYRLKVPAAKVDPNLRLVQFKQTKVKASSL